MTTYQQNNYTPHFLTILAALTMIMAILFAVSCQPEFEVKSIDASEFLLPDHITPKTSIPYQNEDAVVKLGLALGHLIDPTTGESCFSSCHNISKGGHPDEPLPHGGGKYRSIQQGLIDYLGLPYEKMPVDHPTKDSPSFVNGFNDTLILWEGVPSPLPFEEQGRRGFGAHDLDGLTQRAQNDYILSSLHSLAFGDSIEFTKETAICAISAYEQTIVSNQSNASQGNIESLEGFMLWKKYDCGSCHINHTMNPALAPNPIHTLVKTPDLAAWVFSPSDMHTSIADRSWSTGSRLWKSLKMHKESDHKDYDALNEITYSEAAKIAVFIKHDLTDYNLSRYEKL